MKKLMNKKVNMFGKSVPVFVIALLAIGLVSAALLPYFGLITGDAIVSQSVTLEDSPIPGEWGGNFVAGKTIIDCDDDDSGHSLKNHADVEVTVELETTCVSSEDCDGITTEVYGILELTSKETVGWTATDDRKATLYYTVVGDEFKYKVETVTGDLTDYIVVYYPDVNEAKDWNIANAVNLGAVTDVWTTSTLATSLPKAGDYNANPNEGDSYCSGENGYDYFEHCAGAKIWLMPLTDLGGWNPDAWLFETDLIVYSDTTDGKIMLPANGGGFNFCVENDFAINLVPDTYTIETKILPVTA